MVHHNYYQELFRCTFHRDPFFSKECSKNIIDSYTQPFYGLVKFAREEPETVQQMFMDLYSDDGGNVKISDFCSSLYNLNFKTNLLTPI